MAGVRPGPRVGCAIAALSFLGVFAAANAFPVLIGYPALGVVALAVTIGARLDP